MLREEHERRLLSAKEIVLFKEVNCLLVVFIAGHDKHSALLGLLWDDWRISTILKLHILSCDVMCVHLRLKEAFSEDLKERLS